MNHKLIIIICALCFSVSGNVDAQNEKIYQKGGVDFNKNGIWKDDIVNIDEPYPFKKMIQQAHPMGVMSSY